jgi:hypothetical protein
MELNLAPVVSAADAGKSAVPKRGRDQSDIPRGNTAKKPRTQTGKHVSSKSAPVVLPAPVTPLARNLKAGDVAEASLTNQSHVFGETQDFVALGLNSRIVGTLTDRMNVTRATRIQSLALPPLLQGRDLLIKSETGTGKTMAYVLPMVHQLMSSKTTRADGTKGIILSPTRELSLQIYEVLHVSRPGFPLCFFYSLICARWRLRC